jgi:hypothetical protein
MRSMLCGWSPSVPIFSCVAALLGDEFRRMMAIQAGSLAGVPHVEPGELGRVADRDPQVLPGVANGHGHTPNFHRVGCPFMLGHVPLGQTRPLFAVSRIDALVRGEVPVVQSRMFFDMAVFDSRVLRDVPRNGFRYLHPLVHHNAPLELSTYDTASDATRTHGHQSVITVIRGCPIGVRG